MKKLLLIVMLLNTAIASKAQFANGGDRAMNFGGAGSDVEELRYVGTDLYFFARMMGKYQFAGTNYDAGAIGSYPDQDLLFGKISASGTQTLLRRFKSVELSAINGGARIGADGSLYVLRLGMGMAQNIGSLTTPTYGVQLLKIDASGQPGAVKKLNTFSDIEFGTTGVAGPNLYAMQVKDNGDIYAILKSNTIRGSVYAARVLKLDNAGEEIWHYEMTSPNAGTSTAGILVDGMPRQFVDDAGNLTFKVATTGTMSFNGDNLPYEEPYVYAGYGNLKNWIISLNSSGAKKWNTSAYISPTFYGVDPQSGEIYINYQYSRQSPAVAASIAPFSSLPNIAPPPAFSYIPAVYAWSGIITLNTSGSIAKSKANYVNATAYPTQMQIADNGRKVLFSATANGNVFKAGDNFISFDASGHAAMEVDADFNPLTVFRLPAGSAMALGNHKFAFGGSFKTQTTIGSTTLIPNFIDTDFGTRFPAWASIKTDVLIAEGNLDQVSTIPESTTWKGLSTNWNDVANWTNGIPTNSMRAVFSGTPANMPANIPSSSKAGQIYIPVGAEVTLPSGYGLLTLADRIFNDGKLTVENASFLFNFFGASEVKGNGEFYFKGSASTFNFTGKIANTVSFDNSLTMSGVTVNALRFIGAGAKFIGDVTVSSPAENAVSGLSASSFVNGTLTRAVNANGTYIFPVGTGSGSSEKSASLSFKPNNLSGTNSLSVKYASTIPTGTAPSVSVKGSVISSVLNGGFLTLTPNQQPTGGTYGLETSIKGSSNTVADPSRYILIKRQDSSSPWIFQGENTIVPTSIGTGTANVVSVGLTGITSFSDFAVGIGSTPITLPVKLTKFAANVENGGVLLTWETSLELNSDRFIVERSTDGNLFLPIGDIKAKGNSNGVNSYALLDRNPQAGINYYRLKQMDLDGSAEHSEILPVKFAVTATLLKIYPNPVTEWLYVNGLEGKNGVVNWYSLDGRKVGEAILEQERTKVPQVLVNGPYLIKVVFKDGSSFNQKVLVIGK
ncbi:hypothetical protein [Pedobacter xixiisoli]|uniref:Por secretion system C-terminal sorting domain-containing protein n=1 Tax=Pedobacter xixiisoli TaxID=1476464 RepID=A0A285ZRY1_9SPHI|nr:hypothetical protein [Pedobacter xixiisoli]SOD12413.1 hypothetical protein SAMN06297358_0654 [Pedobacter xixiisoli]